MMTLAAVFYLLVGLVATIGAMRGWAKELINTMGIVLAMFVYDLFINTWGEFKAFLDAMIVSDPENNPRNVFFMISFTFLLIVFFAYLGPVAARVAGPKTAVKNRETLQDALLGFVLGAFNGYLIVGAIWFFLEITNYPFPTDIMMRPVQGTHSAWLVQYLPLVWVTPYLKFLLPVAMLLVLVMFV